VSSQVPATISAMVATFSAALPNLTVHDGWPTSNSADTSRVIVGGTDVPMEPAVTVMNNGDLLPDMVSTDTMIVRCTVETWSGSPEDIAGQRVAAVTIMDTMRVALRPNNAGITLGLPTLAWARIAAASMTQVQTATGVKVQLILDVEVMTKPVAT
jgi:hypothetical protein